MIERESEKLDIHKMKNKFAGKYLIKYILISIAVRLFQYMIFSLANYSLSATSYVPFDILYALSMIINATDALFGLIALYLHVQFDNFLDSIDEFLRSMISGINFLASNK